MQLRQQTNKTAFGLNIDGSDSSDMRANGPSESKCHITAMRSSLGYTNEQKAKILYLSECSITIMIANSKPLQKNRLLVGLLGYYCNVIKAVLLQ